MTSNRLTRTLIYGFHEPSLANSIIDLQATGVLQVVHWIGVDSPAQRFDNCIHRWHLRGIPGAAEAAKQVELRKIVQRALRGSEIQIQDQFARNPLCLNFSPIDFQRLALETGCYFAQLLRSTRVEFLIFQNLPHEGFELVLYLVARELGLGTLLLYQTVLPNRFCYCYDLKDFGWFSEVPLDPSQPPELPPEGHRKDLFYMRGLQPNSRSQKLASRFRRWWLHQKISFKLWKEDLGWYKRLGRESPRIPEPERYEFELARTTARQVNWQVPFVYFPLHLQPELTTSAIGDRYSDQILAITELANWIPPTWQVLVKENPKQTHRQRSPEFFRRLRELPRVKMVDRCVDTYTLLEKSEFAATVTGTVGWEAITGGKRVVVFGRPWYLGLEGVHHWPVREDAVELSKTRICRDKLNHSFDLLLQKTHTGIIDVAYQIQSPHFSASANSVLIRDFLANQIVRRRPSLVSTGND